MRKVDAQKNRWENCWFYGKYDEEVYGGLTPQCLNYVSWSPRNSRSEVIHFLADFASCVLSLLDLGSENPPFCCLFVFLSLNVDCLSDDLDVRDTVCWHCVAGMAKYMVWRLGQR